MSQPRTLVVSDAHLGAVPRANERAFQDFLTRVPDLAPDLLIGGDLFDFWFEYRSVVPRKHFRTLRRLAELVDAGVRVRLVGGNHDAWGGDFLRTEVGIELIEGPAILDLGGRRAYVAHGDGLGGGDWGYRLLKRVTRSGIATRAFRLLHPDLGVKLARHASATDERHATGPRAASARGERLARLARRLLREDPSLDLVVFGHSHRPELEEVEPGRFYLNAGDWIHHFSYAIVEPDEIRLLRWSASGSPSPGGAGEGVTDAP